MISKKGDTKEIYALRLIVIERDTQSSKPSKKWHLSEKRLRTMGEVTLSSKCPQNAGGSHYRYIPTTTQNTSDVVIARIMLRYECIVGNVVI